MTIESSSVDDLYCPGCGYNLFGINGKECPECGLAIDRTAAGASRLPWTHRDQIGRIKAFFKTAIIATFRPKKIAREMNRPVSYSDARRFRHICVFLARLATTAGGIVLAIENDWLGKNFPANPIEQILGTILTAASIWLFFLAVTGFPSLFFHPARLPVPSQNRAIALSCYSASAPWLALWIWGCVAAVTLPFVDGTYPAPIGTFITIGIVLVCVIPLAMLLILIGSTARLLGLATRSGFTKQIALGLAMPAAGAILFETIVVGIPVAVSYVAIIVLSLRSL